MSNEIHNLFMLYCCISILLIHNLSPYCGVRHSDIPVISPPTPLPLDRLQVVCADFAPVGLIGGLDVEEDLAEGEVVPGTMP